MVTIYIERMNNIKISSIVAAAKNNIIGLNNELLWHIPEDFKHFKRKTMGKPMIMGRKTFESLPAALKGRDHIVITSTPEYFSGTEYIHYVASIEEAIKLAKDIAEKDGQDEVFIIGGGQIYEQTFPIIDRLYLTRVERDYEGDTEFPYIDLTAWTMHIENTIPADPLKDRPACTIYRFEKPEP